MSQVTDRSKETLLRAFADAWNRHDVDALMSMMTADGVFEASGGNMVDGDRHEGSLQCGPRTPPCSISILMRTGAMLDTS
jgi:ketosteroid isomerase-like protein